MTKEQASRWSQRAKGPGHLIESGPTFCTSSQFLAAQITEVHDYIKPYKTGSMAYLFHTGKASEMFFNTLEMKLKNLAPNENKREGLSSLASGSLKSLFELAQKMDVDIGDQLKEELEAFRDSYLNSQSADQDPGDGLKLLGTLVAKWKVRGRVSRQLVCLPPVGIRNS